MASTRNGLGKTLSSKELKELLELRKKYGLSVAFEGGEAETFTLAGPVFKQRLSVTKSTRHWAGQSGFLELEASAVGLTWNQSGVNQFARNLACILNYLF